MTATRTRCRPRCGRPAGWPGSGTARRPPPRSGRAARTPTGSGAVIGLAQLRREVACGTRLRSPLTGSTGMSAPGPGRGPPIRLRGQRRDALRSPWRRAGEAVRGRGVGTSGAGRRRAGVGRRGRRRPVGRLGRRAGSAGSKPSAPGSGRCARSAAPGRQVRLGAHLRRPPARPVPVRALAGRLGRCRGGFVGRALDRTGRSSAPAVAAPVARRLDVGRAVR